MPSKTEHKVQLLDGTSITAPTWDDMELELDKLMWYDRDPRELRAHLLYWSETVLQTQLGEDPELMINGSSYDFIQELVRVGALRDASTHHSEIR